MHTHTHMRSSIQSHPPSLALIIRMVTYAHTLTHTYTHTHRFRTLLKGEHVFMVNGTDLEEGGAQKQEPDGNNHTSTDTHISTTSKEINPPQSTPVLLNGH